MQNHKQKYNRYKKYNPKHKNVETQAKIHVEAQTEAQVEAHARRET